MDSDELSPHEKFDLWQRLQQAAEDEVNQFKRDRDKRNPDLPMGTFTLASHGFQVLRARERGVHLINDFLQRSDLPEPSKQTLYCEWDGEVKVTVRESSNETIEYYAFDADKGFRSMEGSTTFTPEELAEKILEPFLWDKN